MQIRDKHKGRFPSHDRKVWSSLNSVLGGVEGVRLADVARAVSVKEEHLRSGRRRWQRWVNIDTDAEGRGDAYLHDLEKEIHGNSWPVEWVLFISSMWEDERCTRKGEGMRDYMYDPKKRDGARELHVIHYMEKKLKDIQAIMQEEGEKKFGPDYVYLDGKSRPQGFPKRPAKGREKHGGGIGKKMKLLMPYFVKRKGRNLCLCWRHLEWDFLCEALHLWRKTNKQSHRGAPPAVSSSCACRNERNPYEMRKGLMCPRADRRPCDDPRLPVLGVDFDKKECIERTCGECKGLSRLQMCDEERNVQRHIQYMKRKAVTYTTVKGEERQKHDFVKVSEPIKDFLDHMEARLKDIAPHHCDMAWQRRDWVHLQNNFPKGSFIYVSDFSENFTIEVKNEHQSKYYSQVPVTLYGVVATFWITDVKDAYLPAEKRRRLETENAEK